MIFDIFQYEFMVRALEAGILIGIVSPIIGVFLVLRRYALIADTLSHVSLAGIALALFLGIPPLLTALFTALFAALGIEKLRRSNRVYGESALALFLSGSLAFAVVLLSFARGLNANLFGYLFGSIVTVTSTDVVVIASASLLVLLLVGLFYKELVFTTFDELSARVGGIPTRFINNLLILLAALTVSLAIPIVGALLISALIVVPVVTALQFRKGFLKTLMIAEAVSVVSVFSGILLSFLFDLSTGGTIVLVMLSIFLIVFVLKRGV